MAVTKPTYSCVITPNYYASQDGAGANYQVIWLGAQNGTHSMDRLASDEFAGAWLWKPGASWPTGPVTGTFPPEFQSQTQYQGQWGRAINFHNTSLEPEGWGWSKGPGNSAVAIDFTHGNLSLNVDDNATKEYLVKANVTLGVRHTIAMLMVLGRTDGTTARPGRVRIWYDGTLVLDTGSINTLWRFGPLANGTYVTQRHMWLWNGFYTKALKTGYTLPFEMCWPWLGRTPSEALTNTVSGTGGSWTKSDIPISGRDVSAGPATISEITSWSSDDLVLPVEFGGTGSNPPPAGNGANVGTWATVVQWNATEATPPAPPTVNEQNIGSWTDAVRWNASHVQTTVPGSLTLTAKAKQSLTLTPHT